MEKKGTHLTIAQADELNQLKLSSVLIKVAERVGYHAFIDIWLIMHNGAVATDTNRLYVNRFESFERYQRDQYIIELSHQGLTRPEIIFAVEKNLGVTVKSTTVGRVIKSHSST